MSQRLKKYKACTSKGYEAVITTPVGRLGIALVGERSIKIDFLSKDCAIRHSENSLVNSVTGALRGYFANPQVKFEFPEVEGTPFQHKVWNELKKIPAGKTITYGELAKVLNTAPRAVGRACRTNPCPIIIPCHRVIAAGDRIGGYSGEVSSASAALTIKSWLLGYESVFLPTAADGYLYSSLI